MVTLYTTGDSYIQQSSPTTNYGSATTMFIQQGSGSNAMSAFLKFDLSAEVATIVSATLYLWEDSASFNPVGDLTVKRVTSSWTEGGVTWNNQPSVTSTNSKVININGSLQWYSIDIKDIIVDCVTGTDYGISLQPFTPTGGDTTFTRIAPKEAIISARKPYLVIVYGDKYVYYFSGDDTNTGDTWAQSYETVKKAIDNVPSGYPIHIAEGDYSAQASIDLDKNLTFLCEDYGGGNAAPPLTVVLPVTT